MKKLLSFPTLARVVLSALLAAALAVGLWVVTLPEARARTLSPREMIEEGLPPGKTMDSATKPEFLAAVCAAVRGHRPESPAITRAAVLAHRPYAGDIVATVVRCGAAGDCAFVGTIVRAGIQVAPSEASVIDDAALALAPDCADAIQASTGGDSRGIVDSKDGKEILDSKDAPAEGPIGGLDNFGSGPFDQVPLPGSIGGGGGGFNPQEPLITVCDNGTQRLVRASQVHAEGNSGGGTQVSVPQDQLAAFLLAHPGSFVGVCQPTPTTNQ